MLIFFYAICACLSLGGLLAVYTRETKDTVKIAKYFALLGSLVIFGTLWAYCYGSEWSLIYRENVQLNQQCQAACKQTAYSMQNGICYCATGMNVDVCKTPLPSR